MKAGSMSICLERHKFNHRSEVLRLYGVELSSSKSKAEELLAKAARRL
jgi:hypothetical protein